MGPKTGWGSKQQVGGQNSNRVFSSFGSAEASLRNRSQRGGSFAVEVRSMVAGPLLLPLLERVANVALGMPQVGLLRFLLCLTGHAGEHVLSLVLRMRQVGVR